MPLFITKTVFSSRLRRRCLANNGEGKTTSFHSKSHVFSADSWQCHHTLSQGHSLDCLLFCALALSSALPSSNHCFPSPISILLHTLASIQYKIKFPFHYLMTKNNNPRLKQLLMQTSGVLTTPLGEGHWDPRYQNEVIFHNLLCPHLGEMWRSALLVLFHISIIVPK